MDASALESPIRSNRASSRSACCCTASGIAAAAIFFRYSSATDAFVLAELLANRVHLPAQKILALLFLRARLHVVANALPDAQLGEPVLLELQGERQPLDDVERFEQLQLLVDVQIRRVAGGIRQRRPDA